MVDRPPSPPPSPRPPRAARWLNRATTLILSGGVVGALIAAAPSLLRASGLSPAPIAFGPVAHDASGNPSGNPAVATGALHPPPRPSNYAVEENPRFVPDDQAPRVTELERMYPDGMWPGRNGRPPMDPLPDDARGPSTPSTKPRGGHTRALVLVRERADLSAKVIGRVEASERIMVVREDGQWMLVVHQDTDGATMGWVPRAQITLP